MGNKYPFTLWLYRSSATSAFAKYMSLRLGRLYASWSLSTLMQWVKCTVVCKASRQLHITATQNLFSRTQARAQGCILCTAALSLLKLTESCVTKNGCLHWPPLRDHPQGSPVVMASHCTHRWWCGLQIDCRSPLIKRVAHTGLCFNESGKLCSQYITRL